MTGPLQIKPGGEFDFLSLGGLVIRIDTGLVPFRKATEAAIHVSGAEFNTSANMSDCFGLRTAVASAMVDYPVGDLVAERVKAMGVTPFYKHFRNDGVVGPNIATVYSDRGIGVRAPVVFYNRANEAAAMLKADDFDWKAIFDRGIRWFHSGGLFAALSDTTPAVLAAARASGAVVSFDLNYRAKLWNARGGNEVARRVSSELVRNVDVLVGNEEDMQLGLGISGPEGHKAGALDTTAFVAMIEKVVKEFPNIKVVATTLGSPLRLAPQLERGGLGRRQGLPGARNGARRLRPRRRRRRLRPGPLLRPALRRPARGGSPAWLGPRRAPHHLSQRHDHGQPVPGQGPRDRRLGPHPALGR